MKRLMTLLALTTLSFGAYAADKPASQKAGSAKTQEFTKDQREQMAKNHEAMAACLRSDKPVSECHDEMMKSCKDMGGCGMGMGMHHMGK